jgi:hypothetical protein
MTRAWIAAVCALAFAGAAAAVGLRRRKDRAATGARAWIVQLEDSTSMDDQSGAVRSVQEADVMIEASALREIWTPEHLERLARTYWRFLTRVTLGLIRVLYTERERYVVLLARPFKLITFQAPEYEIDPTRGLVRWRIARGLLVSREGRNGGGHLQIEVRRSPGAEPGYEQLHVEVEVSNFYPSIASRLSRSIYNATQSRLHVLITYSFLRSLVHLDLAERRRTGPRSSPPGS